MTRRPRRAAAPSMTFRQVLVVLSVASAFALGCEANGDDISSGDLGFLGRERRACVGAFAPHNESCWRDPGDGGEEEIAANDQKSQENQSDVSNMDRCAQLIVPPPGTKGTLTVTFTTVTTGGLYAPRNCGAVWIEDSMLAYVRTLELWTAERQMSIVQWNTRACHADPTYLKPDVTTSATLSDPKTHTSKWDMTDFRGNVMPDGQYTLWMQVAENEIFPEGPFLEIPFTKGAMPFTLMPPDQPGFKGITITYTPGP